MPGSKHTTGEAFDIYPVSGSLDEFYNWLRPRWSGALCSDLDPLRVVAGLDLLRRERFDSDGVHPTVRSPAGAKALAQVAGLGHALKAPN